MTNFQPTSPYYSSEVTSWYTGRYVHRSIPAATDDDVITLDPRYANRPDKLSYDLYGTAALWWVFMTRNLSVIRDPIADFVPGIQITVPSRAHVQRVIGA